MKKRYQQETINEIIEEEKLKLNSGVKVITSNDKVVYIQLEDFIEKILIQLKKKSYLK
ncbi:MAG TPA: hypothetical protein PLH46_04750 [Caldisericia bacterium]|nr:hypothetical protein [Caldisericia bacterium]